MFRFFENLIKPFDDERTFTPTRNRTSFVWRAIRPFWPILLASALLTAISTAIELWLIDFGGRLVSMLAETSPEAVWQTHGWQLFGAVVLVLVIRPLPGFLKEALDDLGFLPNAITSIRWQIHRHLVGQSVGWFRDDMTGRIVQRMMQAGSTATHIAYAMLHTAISFGFYAAGSLWLLSSYDPRLTIPLLIWIAAYGALMVYAVPRAENRSERFQAAHAGLMGVLNDTYGNIDSIKLYANSRQEQRATRRALDRFRRGMFLHQRIEVTINALMIVLSSLLIVGLVGTAVFLWQAGEAPLGLIATALALSFRFTPMAEWLLDAITGLFISMGALKDALETVGQPHEIADAPEAKPLTITGGAMTIRKLSHGYGKSIAALDGIDLDIGAGEKIGLVGPSGAGKSTLVNLILRFYEAEGGTIEIDGQDIREVTQDSLRRQIAMVTQDAALLHRSVRANIAFGDRDASLAEIEAAAAKAQAADFIPDLADRDGRTGYSAHVGERGVKLSGGQRQRIALARAVLKDAPILILDEATSALDSESEAAVQAALAALMEGKTVIAIAHRLSTIARMDRIVVLDEGRIVEQGNHAELLSANGLYARLWARQSGGFFGIEEREEESPPA